MSKPQDAFWREKTLESLEKEQWESLCDGCAKCCLLRFEDKLTREIFYTNVCCRYLDSEHCRCLDYPNRTDNVPECVTVTLGILKDPYWLPSTCAYRLLAENKDLPWWHPLVSGNPHTVAESGNSVMGRVVSELEVENLEHYLVDWIS